MSEFTLEIAAFGAVVEPPNIRRKSKINATAFVPSFSPPNKGSIA